MAGTSRPFSLRTAPKASETAITLPPCRYTLTSDAQAWLKLPSRRSADLLCENLRARSACQLIPDVTQLQAVQGVTCAAQAPTLPKPCRQAGLRVR